MCRIRWSTMRYCAGAMKNRRRAIFGELIREDCRGPKSNVLVEAGKGYKIAIETLNEGRIGIGAQMAGVARGAWEYAAKYAQERKQFGKTIADFQGIQFQIAQMATEIE